MPFTPFHWGISVLIQSLLLFLDPLALFIGSIAPDIEGITAWFILPGMGLPLHGSLHSFTGALLLGIITGTASWLSFNYVFPLFVDQFQLDLPFSIPKYSFRCSLSSALIGTLSHIFLDAPLYDEMDLLYPLGIGNPWYNIVPAGVPYLVCILGFFLGASILILRFILTKKKENN